jgi:hypothetical protein
MTSANAIDWAAVRRRLRFIGSALELAPVDVEEVITELGKGNEARLFAFAEKYGQSLEWIITGELAAMLRKLAGEISNQLPLPLFDPSED